MKNVFAGVLLVLAIFAVSAFAHVEQKADTTANFDGYNVNASYDTGVSRVFATVSASTICASSKTDALENWTCEGCIDSGIKLTDITRLHDPVTDGYGFVGFNPEKTLIIIAFRGSHTLQNWMSDLDFASVPFNATDCEGCNVHHGFVDAYQRLRTQMLDAVVGLLNKHPLAAVAVTGHSLGGALAAHAIVDLYTADITVSSMAGARMYHTHNGYDTTPISVSDALALGAEQLEVAFTMSNSHYTFGQPRIGDVAFSKYFTRYVKDPVYRLTHYKDPVPHLPLLSWNFQHPPQEVYWNQDSTSFVVCSSENGEDPKCSDQDDMNSYGVLDHLTYSGYFMTGRKC